MKIYKLLIALLLLSPLPMVQAQTNDDMPTIIDYDARFQPTIGRLGMAVSQEVHATQVGRQVLKDGGNAIDAAVAMGFALAVTLPKAGNLGGGGFMVIHLANGESKAINFREMAPAKAHRDMYLDQDGKVDKTLSRAHRLSSGVPGTPLGLDYALKKYGTRSLKAMVEPAIRLAAKGFEVSDGLHYDLSRSYKRLHTAPATAKIFFNEKDEAWPVGSTLVQKDLAWSLEQIAEHGVDAFYKGEIAKRIVADMAANGGLITMEDMANYKIAEMEPIKGTYRGFEVISMPPPSSGGVHIIQMLNILEGFDLEKAGSNSAQTLQWMTEAMRLAYADRSKFLGDPDFVKVPVKALTSKDYAALLRKGIGPEARDSKQIAPGNVAPYESEETTHYSVMDRWGNAVSVTYTLNFSFGNGIVADGTGILLNNEMDDFSAKPGVPNAYGLLGGEANAIEAGKRPLSSMTPTLLLKDGKPYLVTGSPGGSRIITTVLQIILNLVDHNQNVAVATASPRMHHQWFPDKIYLEQGFSADTMAILKARGYTVETGRAMGSTQSIVWKDGLFYGAADSRRPGAIALGF